MKHLLYLPILCISLIFSQADIDTLWTFTNCGQEGRFGPTLEQCESEYSGTSLESQITMDGFQGYQEFTVQYTGIYSIEVMGAAGNDGDDPVGFGAKMSGNFSVNSGDVIQILVAVTVMQVEVVEHLLY